MPVTNEEILAAVNGHAEIQNKRLDRHDQHIDELYGKHNDVRRDVDLLSNDFENHIPACERERTHIKEAIGRRDTDPVLQAVKKPLPAWWEFVKPVYTAAVIGLCGLFVWLLSIYFKAGGNP